MLARLQSGDFEIDFLEMRKVFTDTPEYAPYLNEDRADTGKMFEAIRDGDYEEALRLSKRVLDRIYIFGNAHLGAKMAHEQLGNIEEAQFHQRVADALFASMCSEKNGRSPKKPCFVISASEEHFYVRRAGFEFISQTLHSCKSVPCDKVTVRDRSTGKRRRLYFDISVPMKHLSRELERIDARRD